MQLNHPDDADLIRVSYHAVTRFVQRILGVCIDVTIEDPKDAATEHCRAAGVTVDDVRRRIWSPGIVFAVKHKHRRADNGLFAAVIDAEAGVIITILAPRTRHNTRMKILSGTEFRRKARKQSVCRNHQNEGAENA